MSATRMLTSAFFFGKIAESSNRSI